MTVLEILILSLCAIGITAVFDARTIVERFFGTSEKNKTIKLVKTSGAVITLAGILILYIIK